METTTMIQIALVVVALVAWGFAAVCLQRNRQQYIEGLIFTGVAAAGMAIVLGIG